MEGRIAEEVEERRGKEWGNKGERKEVKVRREEEMDMGERSRTWEEREEREMTGEVGEEGEDRDGKERKREERREDRGEREEGDEERRTRCCRKGFGGRRGEEGSKTG